MTIKVVIAGVTGWIGRALVPHVLAQDDLALIGAISRTGAGHDVGQAIGGEAIGVSISGELDDALLAKADVLIDFTSPDSVKAHVLRAVNGRCHVIVGTSGLSSDDFAEIDAAARRNRVGVIAAGNFSVTATLMKRFALMAARYVPDVEIIDLAAAQKPDAPSGTGQELAEALAEVRKPSTSLPQDKVSGSPGSRGAAIGAGEGVRVHTVRMPSYVLACEAIFGLPDERLTIRHDAGNSAVPYLAGVTLAVRRVVQTVGLMRGIDTLLD